MKFLSLFIDEIDAQITAQFNANRVLFNGIARLQYDNKGIYSPYIYEGTQPKMISLSDVYDLQTYHRITSMLITDMNGTIGQRDSEFVYGDEPYKQIVASVSCVVSCRYEIMNKLLAEDVALFVAASLSYNISHKTLEALNLAMGLYVTKYVETNSKKVWENEFKSDYKLHPSMYLFSFNYEIQFIAPRSCLKICNLCK